VRSIPEHDPGTPHSDAAIAARKCTSGSYVFCYLNRKPRHDRCMSDEVVYVTPSVLFSSLLFFSYTPLSFTSSKIGASPMNVCGTASL
jgi:hypothetical protein